MIRAALMLATSLLATTSAAADRDPLAGRVAGAAEECISIDRVQGPDIRPDGTIIYRQDGRRLWVTRPVDPCPGLRAPATLIVASFGTRLCRNDRFQVQETTSIIPGPVCRFGPFVPYDKPPTGRNG